MISIWERRLKGRQGATLGSGLAVLVITLFGLTLWSPQANAAPGDLDLSFGGDGIVTTDHGDSRAEALAEQTDGKIVVAGNGATDQFIVARYESDGDPDTTFSSDGFTVIDFGEDSETATSVAIQSDGKVVVGGTSTTTGEFQDEDKFAVARLNADGTLDTTFSQDGKALTPVGTSSAESFTVAITSDGGIVSGGRTWTVPGGYFSMALVRYEPNGDLDPGFGDGDGIAITDYGLYADAYVFALAIQPNDQKIVVGGRAAGDMVVNRYMPSGMPDTTFSGDGSIRLDLSETGSTANALAIRPDGRIVAGGYASQMFALAQLTTAGEPDPQFGGGDGYSVAEPPGGYRFSWINALDIDSDGRIVAGGEVGAWEPNYFYDFAVARFNPKGSFDSSFGGGDGVVIKDVGGSQGENFMRAMLIDQNGKYLLAGGSSDPDRDFALARFQSGGTTPLLERNLTVQRGGTGEGYAYIQRGLYCGNECAQSFEDGAEVTLRAYAQSGSFSGWGGACSGTGDCLLTMDSNKSVTATFTSDAPANDNFVNAQILTGTSDTASGDTTDATHESGEPDHYIPGSSGTSSVWFSWTAPSSGTAAISTCPNGLPSFSVVASIYTGSSVNSLTKVGSGNCRLHRFQAEPGTTYWIAVDGTTPLERGAFDLTLELLDPPANDNFVNSEVLTGASDATTGDTRAASRESGEPDHSGRPGEGSVWFSWVAPASGTVVANICSDLDFDATIAAYTGSSLNSLTEVDSDFCNLVFQAQQGTAYRIAVDGWYSARGTFDLTLELSVPPVNDNFAGAEVLTGTSDTASGDSSNASDEPDEPDHLGYGGFDSVWFSWTAPSSGTAEIDTCGSSFDTFLTVYTGSSLGSLSQVTGNDDGASCGPGSELTFSAVSGTTYRIVIDGYGGGAYSLALLLSAEVQRTLTAAKSGTGQGTVTSSPAGIDCGADCSESFNDGSQVTMTATPQAGSTFIGWSGAGCSGTGSCQVTVNSDQTATANFTDTTAPDTTIDTGPTGTINVNQATFTFHGTAGDTAKVMCKLDASAFADCSSPKTFTALADGSHTVSFRAQDTAGNQDVTPASTTFTVDTFTPPTLEATISKVIVSGPSKLKKRRAKTYKVKITNAGGATATGVKLSVSGKGIKSRATVGSVAAGKTVTVKVKIKAKTPGKVKAKFKVSSINGGSKTATKKITVKK